MKKFKTLVALVILLAGTPAVFAQSGQTVWGSWSFDWEVKDGAGIAIRNVVFDRHYVIYKASMPVIRVQYVSSCGPYADRIDWGNLIGVPWCNGAKVCQRSFTASGRNWLELGVYARIGAYHLYQVWYFSEDGWVQARLYSKGLQCAYDHNHHPYWRMDFDVDGAADNQIFVFDNNRPNEGWGSGWHLITEELNQTKSPASGRVWFVRNDRTAKGIWVIPNPGDGVADSFCNKDAGMRLYHGAEDKPWAFGAWGHLGYDDGEVIAKRDIVFWYVAHMHHEASHGGDQWHGVGPWIFVPRREP